MVRVRVCGCVCGGVMGVCACVMPLICCMELANRLRCSSFCQALKRVASVGSFSISLSLFIPLCPSLSLSLSHCPLLCVVCCQCA